MTSDSSIQLYPVTKAHPAPHLATTLVSWTTATATHQLVNKLWQVEGELHHSNSGCGSSAIAAPWYQRKHSSEAYFHLWKSGSLLGDRSNWLTNAACLARTIWMSQRTVCFQFNLQKSMTPSIAVSITLWSVGDAEFVSNAKKPFFHLQRWAQKPRIVNANAFGREAPILVCNCTTTLRATPIGLRKNSKSCFDRGSYESG